MNKKRPTSDFHVSQLVMKVEHLEYTHVALVKKKKKIRANNVKKKNMLIALYRTGIPVIVCTHFSLGELNYNII